MQTTTNNSTYLDDKTSSNFFSTVTTFTCHQTALLSLFLFQHSSSSQIRGVGDAQRHAEWRNCVRVPSCLPLQVQRRRWQHLTEIEAKQLLYPFQQDTLKIGPASSSQTSPYLRKYRHMLGCLLTTNSRLAIQLRDFPSLGSWNKNNSSMAHI